MILKVRRKKIPVTSLEGASAVYSALRDASGEGASTFRDGVVLDHDGTEIARVSYNGRVWAPGQWIPGQAPLYDNRK
jgi:hypothetical protein